jgi:hypothetical protein
MYERTPITNPAAALRLVRIMKGAFIVSALFFLYLVITIPASDSRPPDPVIETVLTFFALTNIVLGFVIPRFMAKAAQRKSESKSPAAPLQRWFTASVAGFAFLESCSLFGVMLHFLGAELRRSELLIAVGIVATLFFSAGAPPGADEGSISPR